MYTLCMDTSHILLGLAILKDDEVIASYQSYCWKRQSEEIFIKLKELMDEAKISPKDIQQVVITEGPGSYTGVRIAMTIAKVFCAMANLPLYTIGTLDLYAALEKECSVLLDARGNRAYFASYKAGKRENELTIIDFSSFDSTVLTAPIIGDASLIGKETFYPNLGNCFLAAKKNWKLAENIHLVVPEYLKPSESYLVQK